MRRVRLKSIPIYMELLYLVRELHEGHGRPLGLGGEDLQTEQSGDGGQHVDGRHDGGSRQRHDVDHLGEGREGEGKGAEAGWVGRRRGHGRVAKILGRS